MKKKCSRQRESLPLVGDGTGPLLARPAVEFAPFMDGLLLRCGSRVFAVFDGRELVATYDGVDLVVEPSHQGLGIEDNLFAVWQAEMEIGSSSPTTEANRHVPPKYHLFGKWREKQQCNGCGRWFAGGGYHSHTRGGCVSPVVAEAKEARFVATCLTCYSQRLETNSKKEAERWCTSHLKAYEHDCTIIDRQKNEGLESDSILSTQWPAGNWSPPWEDSGVAPSKFLPNLPIIWIDIGEINPYRGRNPRPRKTSGRRIGPYPALVIDPAGNLEDGYHRYYEDFVDNGYSGQVPVQILESRFSRIVAEVVHQLSKEEMAPPTGCDFYQSGFCSVTGGPCPHYEATYRRCEVREYAIANRDRIRQALPEE